MKQLHEVSETKVALMAAIKCSDMNYFYAKRVEQIAVLLYNITPSEELCETSVERAVLAAKAAVLEMKYGSK